MNDKLKAGAEFYQFLSKHAFENMHALQENLKYLEGLQKRETGVLNKIFDSQFTIANEVLFSRGCENTSEAIILAMRGIRIMQEQHSTFSKKARQLLFQLLGAPSEQEMQSRSKMKYYDLHGMFLRKGEENT